MGLEHVDLGGSQDEVAEAAVERLLEVEVVEGFNEVGPVQVSVDAEHLTEDGLAHVGELGRETTALSDPIAGAGELGDGGVEGSWAGWDGGVGAWGVESSGCETCTADFGGSGVVGERDAVGIGGEDLVVVDLAGNPTLHEQHVLVGCDFGWFLARVQPGEGMVPRSC